MDPVDPRAQRMMPLFERELNRIDKEIAVIPPAGIPSLFGYIPLELYGELQLAAPGKYPNIQAYLPTMPGDDVQRHWCGTSAVTLMRQSVTSTRILVGGYGALTASSIGSARVLDFGCGWGRLTRMLAKYIPEDRLYGVDPDETALALCRDHRVRGTFARSDRVPRSLPFDGSFDLIIAYSVFTHLNETTARACISTLRRYQQQDGVLAVTIRPVEYWGYREESGLLDARTAEEMRGIHAIRGFAFAQPSGTEITYGETSMSIDFAKDLFGGYRLQTVEWTADAPFQIVLLLTAA
jgi:SAM-dependent methyltransferase